MTEKRLIKLCSHVRVEHVSVEDAIIYSLCDVHHLQYSFVLLCISQLSEMLRNLSVILQQATINFFSLFCTLQQDSGGFNIRHQHCVSQRPL